MGPAGQTHIPVARPHMGRIEDGHMIGYYFMEAEYNQQKAC